MCYAGAQTPSVSNWQADEALAELGGCGAAHVPRPMSQEQPMSQDFGSQSAVIISSMSASAHQLLPQCCSLELSGRIEICYVCAVSFESHLPH